MVSVLHQYYEGITSQLRSEVDFINALFQHQGVKGAGNEAALRDLLARYIPKRFGVGTGIVIDRHGDTSRQCDIIIYDTFLYPSLLSLTSTHLFPVDFVYATIEVKTTLTSQSTSEAKENIASVRRLDYLKLDFGDQWVQDNAQVFGIRSTTPPIGIVFAYNTDAKKDTTLKEWFIPTSAIETPLSPSLIGCLDIGLVGFRPNNAEATQGSISIHPEAGMTLQCRSFPVIRKRENVNGEITSADDVQFLHTDSDMQFLPYEGIYYPVKKIGEHFMAIDQSRVLLNFLVLLHEFLSKKRIHPAISFFGTYVSSLDMFTFEA